MKDGSLLEIVCRERLATVVQDVLNCRESYCQANAEVEKAFMNAMSLELNDEQKMAIDDIISAANSRGGEYGYGAYCQGFCDGIRVMFEIYEVLHRQEK